MPFELDMHDNSDMGRSSGSNLKRSSLELLRNPACERSSLTQPLNLKYIKSHKPRDWFLSLA